MTVLTSATWTDHSSFMIARTCIGVELIARPRTDVAGDPRTRLPKFPRRKLDQLSRGDKSVVSEVKIPMSGAGGAESKPACEESDTACQRSHRYSEKLI